MNYPELFDKWKAELPEFYEKTELFLNGELAKPAYKGFSGRFGSYAQRDQKHFMLRLRTPGGRVRPDLFKFTVMACEKYGLELAHHTTCQTLQLHNLTKDQLFGLMKDAVDANILVFGGGGDYPRNTMCSPLSGVEAGENFDVLPYAQAAGKYCLRFINAEPMPRKLKVAFSNSPANEPHATYRDMGFVSRPDGNFDVYVAGGLGNNPRFGVKVAEAVDPQDILIYIKTMWIFFRKYGNYTNRGKARTRYIQETLGGVEETRKAYLEILAEVQASHEDLRGELASLLEEYPADYVGKTGDGSTIDHPRAIPQKQEGLYAVAYHPIGGSINLQNIKPLASMLADLQGTEMRLAPDETAYIINLTGAEAQKVIDATDDSAATLFETSVSCIGASICQVGLRDSQNLLKTCVEAVRAADLPANALPRIHISGCPSSCGTHQTGVIGFRGASKKVDGKMNSAFQLYINGSSLQGQEAMGEDLGAIEETSIPAFLIELGQIVAASGMDFNAWNAANPGALKALGQKYTA